MESTLTKVQCKKYFFTTEWRNRNWFSDFFYKINVLCHSCEWKLKGQKNKRREEFSMLLFLYSRVMEINYTTAISKKKLLWLNFQDSIFFPKGSLRRKDQCAESSSFRLFRWYEVCFVTVSSKMLTVNYAQYMDPIQMNHLDTRIVTTL